MKKTVAGSLLLLVTAGALSWWFGPIVPKPPPPAVTPSAIAHLDGGTIPVKQAEPASDRNFNPGWIGAACRQDQDCTFAGGFCLLPDEGFPGGTCTQRCQRF